MDEPQGKDLDAVTLASLRSALGRIDPVPAGVREAAMEAFAWRAIDAELAELTYDSVLDERALAGVRGDAGPRLVTFEAPDLTIEVEVAEPARRLRRLVGQLVPPAAGVVRVHHAGEQRDVEADELGRFVAEDVHAGPVRISCDRGAGGRRVDTGWVTL